MAIFGKSDEELKKREQELDQLETNFNAEIRRKNNLLDQRKRKLDDEKRELENKKIDITKSKQDLEKLKHQEKSLIKWEVALGKREQEISHKELKAKNDFAEQQHEAFQEVISSRIKQLDLREKDLQTYEHKIDDRLKDLFNKENDIANRDRSLKERELDAEAGFATKNQTAIRELEKREDAYVELEKQLKSREDNLFSNLKELEMKKETLRQKEEEITKAEIKCNEGFTEQRSKLDDELTDKRRSFEIEFADLRKNKFDELNNDIEKERSLRLEILNKEIAEKRLSFSDEVEKFQTEKQKDIEGLNNKKQKLDAVKAELKKFKIELGEKEDDLEYEKARIESKNNELNKKEDDIEKTVDNKISERIKSFESVIKSREKECERLRNSIKTTSETIAIFDELKRKLGDEDPEKVLLELNEKEEELKNLRKELLDRPSKELFENNDKFQKENEELDSKNKFLSEENQKLKKDARIQNELEAEIETLKTQKKSLKSSNKILDADNNKLNETLRRYTNSNESEQERENRIEYITSPLPEIKTRDRNEDALVEIDWLEGIIENCKNYGFVFPKRIIYAYHTALKTAEWAPLTVLAGVSGTGKSKLPELYAHFGGFNFLNVPVQPNWDSQEAMLGFFNSIDNYFDAQPILRFLAQTQKKQTDEYPEGLADVMNIILLDEMNLAHIELYFAEFLSKLEQRRGQKIIPAIDVKLGSKMDPCRIPMGQNVLWTGTMNQDETTKSLSDKVLDRGIIINFPRPETLKSIKSLGSLENPPELIKKELWESWCKKDVIFSNKVINPYKLFLEDMNKNLANAGRALGHRVWQSVEYYMANHPNVIQAQTNSDDTALSNAMKIAFEDQLVQKVMPKLRGIETRGKTKTECLDKIRGQLENEEYDIVNDFDLACEFGYGQFMWNSATYLKVDVSDSNDETENE